MKACGVCGRLFADEAAFCQADGQELSRVSQAPNPGDPNDARVGQVLCERYLVFRVVADGGMGRVYEALDQLEGRHVALKILHEDVAQDAVSVERFKREYEVSRSLPHGYIVEVTDFQALNDSYVLVMEFLVGEELRAVLKRDVVMPPERVIRMVSQVALGLDEAHKREFIHRDLKPDNIFLCQTQKGDIAKVLDFGSVKDRKRTSKQLTVMGTTIGSPYYMSPEQAQGLDTLDHRADVWALSAMLYECLTGSVPFHGTNGPSILIEILRKDPTPASEASAGRPFPVPRTVDRVLSRGLRKAAAGRTASVGELADELGYAYGLEGDHTQWAITPEAELATQVHAKLPELVANPASHRRPDNVAEAFFGEEGALGDESVASQPSTALADESEDLSPVEASTRQSVQFGGDLPTGQLAVPVSGAPLWLYAILGLLLVAAVLGYLFWG